MIPIEQLSAIIKSLIISNQNATTIDQLQKEFRENEGYPMPLYGCLDAEDFLRNRLSDAVKVHGRGPKAIVKPVLNSKTQHIHNLVSEQKPQRVRKRPSNANRKRHTTNENSCIYSKNFPLQYFGHQQSYSTAWFESESFKPGFQPNYGKENFATTANYFGHSILGNPMLWQMSENQISGLDYSKEICRKTTNQSTSTVSNLSYEQIAQDINFSKVDGTLKKPLQTSQYCDKKWSQALSRKKASNDSGYDSQFKSKVHGNSNSQTGAASTEEANVGNSNTLIPLADNDSYNFDCINAVSEFTCDNRIMLPQHMHEDQTENVNKSTTSKKDSYVDHLEEFHESLNKSSELKQDCIQNSQYSNRKTLRNTLSNCEDCNEHQNGIQNNHQLLETTELGLIATCEVNNNTLVDMNSSKRLLLYAVSEVSDTRNSQDSDDAIPHFAINNRVFSLDFPENTVSFGIKIEPFKMPDELQAESIISIYIAEIHNPFRFWFHYDIDELDELMNNIEQFYAQDAVTECYKLLPEHIQRGQICAALYDDAWHRAEILSNVIDDKVKVFYLDYGTVGDISPDELLYLHVEFSQARAYACRGSLAEVNPIRLHWSTQSTIAFLTMVKNRKLHAKICEIDTEHNVYYLQIVDNHAENVIHINRELIKMQYATKCYEWIKSKLTGTPRLRHRREEYPTFEMLEDGNYPTFVEIYSMEINGIDYENITDKMIYHPSIIYINNHSNTSFLLLSNNPFKEEILNQLTEESERESI